MKGLGIIVLVLVVCVSVTNSQSVGVPVLEDLHKILFPEVPTMPSETENTRSSEDVNEVKNQPNSFYFIQQFNTIKPAPPPPQNSSIQLNLPTDSSNVSVFSSGIDAIRKAFCAVVAVFLTLLQSVTTLVDTVNSTGFIMLPEIISRLLSGVSGAVQGFYNRFCQ